MHFPKKTQLEAELQAINQQMADPAVLSDGRRMRELAQQLNEKETILGVVTAYEKVERELAEAQVLMEGSDDELASLAAEDVETLTAEQARLQKELQRLLVPKDPRDSRDVILEIRAGAGGEEASLFAAELFRAYVRYGEVHGWRIQVIAKSESEQGGLKEVVAEISGQEVFGTLKFERGVHRVQRVPETEKQGRIHTSTVTVAVLPQAEEQDIEVKPEDLRIDTYRASGAGGQHVNKTSSAIRITHLPTGVVVACQEERSQHKNKAKAMSLLRARLLEAQEEERRSKEASERKAQVGTGDRSEKIRTYNFPQDRITDHRIKESWSGIELVMLGQLSPIFEALAAADHELKLAAASA